MFRLIYMGRFAPLHSGLGFRLIGNGSLLLLLVHLYLGDDHMPLAQPSTRRFHVFGAAGFVQESSQRSSNISWFDHVQFACASTQSKFETRFYEGKSLSSIMPSVSKVVKVSHSPCQEWELKVNSQRYDLMSSKPSDTRSVPMSVRDAAVLERTLRSALESYNFQLRTMTALFRFSGDSGQISLELWPS